MRRQLIPSCVAMLALVAAANGGLSSLPGYERYKEVSDALPLGSEGRISNVRWSDDEPFFTFARAGKFFRFDLGNRSLEGIAEEDQAPAPPRGPRRPPRAQQRDVEPSPDGRWRAVCRDWNVIIEEVDGDGMLTVTTEGTRKHRFGKASWVYGEELRQIDAMWWSPDSTKLAYYELDETGVEDYYLTGGLTEWRTTLLVEGYPKAGEPNPIARLWIYDLLSGERTPVDLGDADGDEGDQYIYNARFSPNGCALLFNRTNRWQNVLELVAADPKTGQSRVVLTETQDTWQDNRPEIQFLDDGERFIWATEKTGWKQYELRHLDGSLLTPLTRGEFPASAIVHLDEEAGVMFYTAFSDDHPLNLHLHSAMLDGSGQARLTNDPLHHTVTASPDGRWFIVRAEAYDTPPVTTLRDRDGEIIATLAEADASEAEELGLHPPELFAYKADDGMTDLYGILHKPSNFDPALSYPLVIEVYGGPTSQRVRNTYRPANAACEFGFIIAVIDNRGTVNRGKAFADAVYMKLGIVDMKDQADGAQHLVQRPYIDDSRVGIFGHSYGGYLAALGLLKYPDLFHVAVASGAVTDWRNYDTIYTERYMRLPEDNPEGYDGGSCLTYADQLEGKLLILHGMVDDNVHPANAWQLVHALHEAGKDFEMMMYPTRAHGLGSAARDMRWRFLVRHLIEQPVVSPRPELAIDVVDDKADSE